MAERQFAAGGVVIKRENDELKVLLIKDSYGHWTWAKGHIEEGESPEEAAVREISEETGLSKVKIIGLLGKQEYYFTFNDKKIFKTVHVFLLNADVEEKIVVQTEEIQEAVWCSPEDALNTIEYEGSRALLEKGIKEFDKEYCEGD